MKKNHIRYVVKRITRKTSGIMLNYCFKGGKKWKRAREGTMANGVTHSDKRTIYCVRAQWESGVRKRTTFSM